MINHKNLDFIINFLKKLILNLFKYIQTNKKVS